MGILTILDSREHRLAQLWRKIVRFTLAIRQALYTNLER